MEVSYGFMKISYEFMKVSYGFMKVSRKLFSIIKGNSRAIKEKKLYNKIFKTV